MIKKNKKGDYPRTFVFENLKKDENKNFVIIVETYKDKVINYFFEIVIYGKVKVWYIGKWNGKIKPACNNRLLNS